MRTRHLRTSAAIAAAAIALLAAGCGDGQSTAKEAAPPRAAESPVGSAATTDGGQGKKAAVPAELKFTTTTVDGQTFEGTSLAGKDAVLWFWAPWCSVCRSEAPTIARTAAKWGDKVTFVGVPGQGRTADMKKFVADTGLEGFPHAIDTDGSLWSRFGVPAQPALAFINDDGTVKVALGPVGANQFDDELERLTQK
ncbi:MULTISPECIES: redoxin domain-containing protein [unclassified Streptomyces]|uniref:redoxin domain-containing protein n=1 Tax=unclassified Streptomyces TaxID=2593676 RepID=UPI0005AA25D0|nr:MULTISPECIES: redoxin domain-containing protein [unclassified Streptomyces]ODA69118.1 Soluble secreted antigen MPT53 precursor [Streptomyces sp. AVP053U2]